MGRLGWSAEMAQASCPVVRRKPHPRGDWPTTCWNWMRSRPCARVSKC